MRKRSCILYSCVLLLAVSCVESLPYAEGSDSVLLPVQLSFSLERAGHSTKADAGLTELTEGFRGLEDIRLYALPSNNGTQALWPARQLPDISGTQASTAYSGSGYHNGIVQNNHAHLYPTDFASLPLGTKRAIVYGRAPYVHAGNTIFTDKARNGSLDIVGLTDENQDISAIAFKPDPIMTEEANGVADNIAAALNYTLGYNAIIRNGVLVYDYEAVNYTKNGTTVTWNSEIANEELRNCFNEFTEHGQMMSGTGAYVEQKLTTLFRALSGLLTLFTEDTSEEAALYKGLCEAILERFDNRYMHIEQNSVTLINKSRTYPINFGLPAGSAVLRWKGSVFDAVVRNDFDRIAAIDHFCYMPRLYYFANSTISTSRDDDIEQYYTASNRYWTDILRHYDREKEVVPGTRAVALDDSLQYACSMLVATVRASANQLPDSEGNSLSLRDAYNTPCFPMTGIIIGGQYEQDYSFTPKTGNDIEEYYLYDNQISDVFLTAVNADEAPEFRTLVLPTRETRDVYFYLEFRNDSDRSFTGADGLIVPGSYFYLSGKLDFPEEQQKDEHDIPLTRVFTQDHATKVSCLVDSFENAFICVPEMETQQLRLGVKTSVNWKMSTPKTYILD